MPKLPDITIECSSFWGTLQQSRFTANWRDDKARYHVWINGDGRVDETIHKNSIADQYMDDGLGGRRLNPDYFDHRALDLNAKANSHIAEAIRAMAKDEALLRGYYERAIQKQKDDEAAKQTAYAEKMRNALLTEGADLGGSFLDLVKELNEHQLLKLAQIVSKG